MGCPAQITKGFGVVCNVTLNGCEITLVIAGAEVSAGELETQVKFDVTITLTISPAKSVHTFKESRVDGAGAFIPLICH